MRTGRPAKHTPYEQAKIADNWHNQPEWVTLNAYAASCGVSWPTLRQYLKKYDSTYMSIDKRA